MAAQTPVVEPATAKAAVKDLVNGAFKQAQSYETQQAVQQYKAANGM